MNGDAWLFPVPAWLPDTPVTTTTCGSTTTTMTTTTFNLTSKPLVSVSDCEFPDIIAKLTGTEPPRDPLAALPQSPVSSSPVLSTTSTAQHARSPTPTPTTTSQPIPTTSENTSIRPLPSCMEGDNCSLKRLPALRAPLDLLARAPPLQVGRLLGGSANHACAAWRAQRDTAPARVAVLSLLHDGGIRLDRRKRLGSRVAPELKKAVRAARNRERSQALRRHHKRRLGMLDAATDALNTHCRALRTLVRQLLHMHSAPDALQRALERVPGEELRHFLNSDIDQQMKQ